MRFLDELKLKALFLVKNGRPLVVIRPRDPDLALRLTREAMHEAAESPAASHQKFQEVIQQQQYRFMGYAGKSGMIVDATGQFAGTLQPGDSFIPGIWSGRGKELHPATWNLAKAETGDTEE